MRTAVNMPTFFVFKGLEDGYDWYDFEMAGLGLDYATDVLNIPEEYLESVELVTQDKIGITLIEDKSIFREDWYHCLLPHAA